MKKKVMIIVAVLVLFVAINGLGGMTVMRHPTGGILTMFNL